MSKISLNRPDAELIEQEWDDNHSESTVCRVLWRLNTQLVTACAVGTAYMGYSWMTDDSIWMLNPMIAFPVATLLVILPHLNFWD